MKAFTYRGPWADYQVRVDQSEIRIASLSEENSHWRGLAEEARHALEASKLEKEAESRICEELRNENCRARGIIAQLELDVKNGLQTRQCESEELRGQLSAVSSEVQRLTQDNLLLKNELAKSVQVGLRNILHTLKYQFSKKG